jgi:hypothetical protein
MPWKLFKMAAVEPPHGPTGLPLASHPKPGGCGLKDMSPSHGHLSIVYKTQKQPRSPSKDGWIRKMHTYIMEYLSAMRKESLTFESTQMTLGDMMPSGTSQAQKDKWHTTAHTCRT